MSYTVASGMPRVARCHIVPVDEALCRGWRERAISTNELEGCRRWTVAVVIDVRRVATPYLVEQYDGHGAE